jgi:hypothetical protein
MARRLSVGLVLAALVIMMVPSVALASVEGGCTGEATILGETYTPANDTPKNAIPIPNQEGVQVTYSGSVNFENKNHSGSVKVQVGPFNIAVGDWDGPNQQDERGVTNKIYELDDFRDKLPIWIPGVWKVSGEHSAGGNSCSGFAMIKLEGSALGSPVGLVTIVALVGLGYLAVRAIMKRRMVAAAIAAVFFGLFLAVALMMFGVKPLDTVTTVVVPIVLAIVAVVAAMYSPRSPFAG